MYLSLRKLAKKYDLHPDTIRKMPLIKNIHYVQIGKNKRYHIDNMHKFLCQDIEKDTNSILDRFLI
ncbi:MAG: hypothetical protein WA916_06100 [Arcobacter sp.]|uniref:hypothetical protein n=1 Tax=Arcobacter sp. TaxID=1872629 RepID=UPI003C76498C